MKKIKKYLPFVIGLVGTAVAGLGANNELIEPIASKGIEIFWRNFRAHNWRKYL